MKSCSDPFNNHPDWNSSPIYVIINRELPVWVYAAFNLYAILPRQWEIYMRKQHGILIIYWLDVLQNNALFPFPLITLVTAILEWMNLCGKYYTEGFWYIYLYIFFCFFHCYQVNRTTQVRILNHKHASMLTTQLLSFWICFEHFKNANNVLK